MSRITTVIFDMYETLAHNSPELWIRTFGEICRVQGMKVDHELLYREWKALEMGFRRERLNFEEPEKSPPFTSYEEAWRDCFQGVFRQLSLDGDAASAAKATIRDMGLREAYPDALEMMPQIQARWKTGVLSNADEDYLLPLLDRVGWRFDGVLSSERARAYKPLPAPFVQIMAELDVSSDETIYVGDTPYDDILGAKNVGMKAAWINRYEASPDPKFPKPDYEVRNLSELLTALEAVS